LLPNSAPRFAHSARHRLAASFVLALALVGLCLSHATAQEDDAYPIDCPGTIGPDGLDLYYYQSKLFNDQQWVRTGYPQPGVLNIASFEGSEDFIDVTEEWKWTDPTATFSCARIVIIPGVLVVDAYNGSNYGGQVVPFGIQESDTLTLNPLGGEGGGGGDEEVEEHTYLCFRYRYSDGSYGPWLWCEQLS
jgi:hypothetical protein